MGAEIHYTWCEYDASRPSDFRLGDAPSRIAEARIALMRCGGDPGTEQIQSAYRIDADDIMYRMRMMVP